MKIIVFLAVIITALCPLLAADEANRAADPFAGAFFPPEMVMMAHEQIGLTQEQADTIRARMEKLQARAEELRTKMEAETTALSALAKQDHVDETAVVAQLDKVLDVERELKHLHVGLLVAIKNLLTPDQLTKLRDLAKDGGAKLADETRQRLTAKVERVKAEMEKWAASGRDPSAIRKMMEEQFKPLIDSGKVLEAEAVLDRVIEQIGNGAK